MRGPCQVRQAERLLLAVHQLEELGWLNAHEETRGGEKELLVFLYIYYAYVDVDLQSYL